MKLSQLSFGRLEKDPIPKKSGRIVWAWGAAECDGTVWTGDIPDKGLEGTALPLAICDRGDGIGESPGSSEAGTEGYKIVSSVRQEQSD